MTVEGGKKLDHTIWRNRLNNRNDMAATAGSLLTAVVVIFSAVFAVYKWYLRQNEQDKEIERMKSEQCLLTYGILACLKGLKEQGCNGSVTEAIDKIQKHINKQAHDQED